LYECRVMITILPHRAFLKSRRLRQRHQVVSCQTGVKNRFAFIVFSFCEDGIVNTNRACSESEKNRLTIECTIFFQLAGDGMTNAMVLILFYLGGIGCRPSNSELSSRRSS
jgi:hypothetical protein